MQNENYKIKNPSIRLKDVPRAAVLVLQKYGLKAFFYKSLDLVLLKVDFLLKGGNILIKKELKAMELYNERFRNIQPMRYIKIERSEYRINIVTDSIKKESLFGGVATSLILATLFSNKYNLPLRIITRETENNPKDFEEFLKLMGITIPREVEYFSDYDRNRNINHFGLEVSENDIFLATSWWSAAVIRSINRRKKFFYILQEVEKFFYPNGDEQYLCEGVLQDLDINYIINSELLFEYYRKNGYEKVINNSVFFEPAFLKHLYSSDEWSFKEKKKHKLFFYSRPNNPRNLFFTGLRLLDEALQSGIINKDEWDIYFAGSDVPSLVFSNGEKPIILGQMDWKKYSEFLKTVDLGFCLMYTPHPSYPPLDIAASGGVVLTNTYDNKQSLFSYSQNIICEKLDSHAMLLGFEKAIDLAKNILQRKKNYESDNIERDWEKSFEKVMEFMEANR